MLIIPDDYISLRDVERLHTALNYCCPDAVTQNRLTEIRNSIRGENLLQRQVVAMLEYVHRGINSGQW